MTNKSCNTTARIYSCVLRQKQHLGVVSTPALAAWSLWNLTSLHPRPRAGTLGCCFVSYTVNVSGQGGISNSFTDAFMPESYVVPNLCFLQKACTCQSIPRSLWMLSVLKNSRKICFTQFLWLGSTRELVHFLETTRIPLCVEQTNWVKILFYKPNQFNHQKPWKKYNVQQKAQEDLRLHTVFIHSIKSHPAWLEFAKA